MTVSVNKVTLLGNVGRDPDIRSSNNGNMIVSFSLATSDTWRDKTTGERRERTEWHNVVIFNENLVRVVQAYVKKGSKLYLEGQLQTRKYTDRDGNERSTTEVVLQRYQGTLAILDGKPEPSGLPDAQDMRSTADIVDDKIPF